MHFVLYTDKNYEHMVKSFIESCIYAGLNEQILYYTLGFESDLDYPNLTKIRFELLPHKLNLVYYKPDILKDSLKYIDTACFFDSDILMSKRFKVEDFENKNLDFPLSCLAPEQYPYVFWTNGVDTIPFDDGKIREYFNVPLRTMGYVYSCQISYNKSCEDFIDEWLSVCDNKYLLNKGKILGDREYFPFYDETPYNLVLWKRNIQNNLGHRFLNTAKFETFLHVESNDDITDTYLDNLYGLVKDSSEISFYHGFKDKEEIQKVLDWMSQN